MKRTYEQPKFVLRGITIGEFCASACASKPNGKATWAEIVADINSAGYRTLAEAGDSSAPNMVS